MASRAFEMAGKAERPLEDVEMRNGTEDSIDDESQDATELSEDLLHHEYEPLEESVYGWAVSMIVREMVWLERGTSVPLQRVAMIVNSIFLVVATIALQVFLLISVSRLLSAPAVMKIRETYGAYEAIMYPNHTSLTVNGFPRGIPGYRNETLFQTIPMDMAKTICQIPLSHPWYLMAVLFIWTMTCQIEMRTIVETAIRLLWITPRTSSVHGVVNEIDGESGVQVEGLTLMMKGSIGFLILLPRAMILLLLNYLGCRWLTATLGLGDVLLNGLALEFLVLLKELVYNVCMSARNRVDTTTLLFVPLRKENKVSFLSFFEGLLWGLASAMWTILYVQRLQQVLPDYRWDVRDLCQKNMKAGPLF